MSRATIAGLARLCHQVGLAEPAAAGPLSQALSNGTGGAVMGSACLLRRAGLPMGQALSASATMGAPAARRGNRGGLQALIHNYKQLSKFKLSSLVVATAAGGFIAGSGDAIDWAGLGWTALGTYGAAACANTLNQLYEVANDARMSRTMNRPLPAGRMTRLHAALFALVTGASGVAILHEKVNPLTAGLGAANIVLYAGVYTPLKQLSIANTWVGAVVGAIPPLMGWAAASGRLEPGASVLSLALFSWQMPHFLALAWLCKDDYLRGGFRMLSGVDASGRRTAAAALRHCAYLAPVGALAVLAGVATWPFAAEAAAMSAAFGAYAARFYARPSQHAARRMFRASLVYLPALMALMALHRTPNTHIGWGEVQARLEQAVGPSVAGAAGALASRAAGCAEALEDAVAGVASRLDSGIILSYVRCPSKVYAEDLQAADRPTSAREQTRAALARKQAPASPREG